MKRSALIVTVFTAAALVLSACATTAGAQAPAATQAPVAQPTQAAVSGTGGVNTGTAATPQATGNLSAIAALENSVQQIYQKVNPSVVNIQVMVGSTSQSSGQNPLLGNPQQQSPSGEALGSGFVWDKQGHIITNNHVVANATSIDVTFSDGLTVPAKVVGTDLNSDLAVIQVNAPANDLVPVKLADSTKAKIGQIVMAIGNPYGLQGSMSVGFISGLGRDLPVGLDSANQSGSSTGGYVIPDIIQTDAAINPGNSGGVLVDENGMVLGVTSAIESSSGSGSGVGFVIPSVIVQKVVPSLIKNGSYQHPWVGIAGTTMTPEIAQAMGLNSEQRGALVVEVSANSPASKAGLQPSTKSVTINGQQTVVGGDVIVSVNGSPVNVFDDLMTYLERYTSVGQKVTLGILRNGKQISVDLTLAARPATTTTPSASTLPQTPSQQPQTTTGGWLGISGYSLDSTIDQGMNLPSNQQGVLVVQVQSGSPAASAGLKGGSKVFSDNGQSILIGGDVITGIDGQAVSSIEELRSIISQDNPGQQVKLSILRNGSQSQVSVTLGTPGG